jgi:hypothetical protein
LIGGLHLTARFSVRLCGPPPPLRPLPLPDPPPLAPLIRRILNSVKDNDDANGKTNINKINHSGDDNRNVKNDDNNDNADDTNNNDSNNDAASLGLMLLSSLLYLLFLIVGLHLAVHRSPLLVRIVLLPVGAVPS